MKERIDNSDTPLPGHADDGYSAHSERCWYSTNRLTHHFFITFASAKVLLFFELCKSYPFFTQKHFRDTFETCHILSFSYSESKSRELADVPLIILDSCVGSVASYINKRWKNSSYNGAVNNMKHKQLSSNIMLLIIYRLTVSWRGICIQGRHCGWQWTNEVEQRMVTHFLEQIPQI